MSADDFKLLKDRILTFAKKAIVDDGFVIPVGASVSANGEVIPVRRIQPMDDKDTTESIVSELLGVFRGLAKANQVRAVAWCVDMRVIPPGSTKTDALVLFYESSDGDATVLTAPYRGAPGSETTFAEPYLQTNRPQIFVTG